MTQHALTRLCAAAALMCLFTDVSLAIDPPTVVVKSAFEAGNGWTWEIAVSNDGAGGISSFHVRGLDETKSYGFDRKNSHAGPADFTVFTYDTPLGADSPSWFTDWDTAGNKYGSFEFFLGSSQFTGKETLNVFFDYLVTNDAGKNEVKYFKVVDGKNVDLPASSIPEPADYLLLLCGLAVMGTHFKRRSA